MVLRAQGGVGGKGNGREGGTGKEGKERGVKLEQGYRLASPVRIQTLKAL